MIAVVGIPGSAHHTYRRYSRSERAEAEAWLAAQVDRTLRENPALGSIPAQILSDREAAKIRYADGKQVYRQLNV